MKSYYAEILEILKNDKEVKEFLASKRTIREELDFSEYLERRADVVGACSSEEQARKNCFERADEVSTALSWGHLEVLEIFEDFLELAEEGYININTLELTPEVWLEHDFNRRHIISTVEKIRGLSFRNLETITKRNIVFGVLIDIENDSDLGKSKNCR